MNDKDAKVGTRVLRTATRDLGEVAGDRCLFCGGELAGRASNEHVVPLWLQARLETAGQVEFTHRSSYGEVLSKRVHPLTQWVEGRVCRSCNNGWMSSLEQRARPILEALWDGTTTLADLSDDQRVCLSRWALKTSVVLNSSSNYPTNVPSRHARHVARRAYQLPRGVYVIAGECEGASEFEWLQGSALTVYPGLHRQGDAEASELVEKSYRIGVRLGTVVLMVMYLTDHPWRLMIAHGYHHVLWPLRYTCWGMPAPDFPPEVAAHPLMAFMVGVWVAHERGKLGIPTEDVRRDW